MMDAAGIRAFLAEHYPRALDFPIDIAEPDGDTLLVTLHPTTDASSARRKKSMCMLVVTASATGPSFASTR